MAPRCENAGTARHKMSGKIAEPNHLLWIMTGDHTTWKKHLQGNRITISNSGIRTAHIGKFPVNTGISADCDLFHQLLLH